MRKISPKNPFDITRKKHGENKSLRGQRATILIITLLILEVLLLLGSYFLIFAITESRISKSQEAGSQTYYLAEAGINEAIWKLKNDPVWANDFIDPTKNPSPGGDYWTATFSRSFAEGSYTVTIQNSAQARGKITSVSTMPLPKGKTAQRVVKTAVFKALASLISDSALFTGGTSENVDIKFSRLRINKGNLFSNHNLDIKWLSAVEVYDNPETEDNLEGQVLAVGNLNQSGDSSLTSETICAKNACTEGCAGYTEETTACSPNSILLPLVDFDSSSPDSFKSRAQTFQDMGQCGVLCNGIICDTGCVYSSSEFEDLLWQVGEGGTLTLNNIITYVTGNIELKGGRNLIVNGTLIADDSIYIGEHYSWTRGGQKDGGLSQITINRPDEKSPSGLLAKRKINFGSYSSFQPLNITGIIYANDEIRIVSIPQTFNVVGGMIGRKFSSISVWQWLNITLDNDIILYGLGYKIDDRLVEPTYSPIITIEHWEETY